MFISNLKYLINLVAKQQHSKKFSYSDLSRALDGVVSPATISGWVKRGHIPSKNIRSVLSNFFSEALGIPFDLFDNGQALLEKDFRPIWEQYQTEQSLHPDKDIPPFLPKGDTQAVSNESVAGEELTAYEKLLPYKLREIYSGTRKSPLPRATIDRIFELFDLIGIDSDLQIQLISTIKVIGESYHGKGQGDQDAGQDNQKR